jgi:hypothetical protein
MNISARRMVGRHPVTIKGMVRDCNTHVRNLYKLQVLQSSLGQVRSRPSNAELAVLWYGYLYTRISEGEYYVTADRVVSDSTGALNISKLLCLDRIVVLGSVLSSLSG